MAAARSDASTTLAGRVALVTGAAQGLGAAIAQALAEAGAKVVLVDGQPSVQAAAESLQAAGLDALGLRADVRDESQWEGALSAAISRFGFVDVLVNNAALMGMGSVWDIGVPAWDEVMAVNLRGCFLGCRTLGRHMRERGKGGRIINMASLAGQQASSATGAHYAASKAGILSLTRSFAVELARDAVTVNALAPATVRSSALEQLDRPQQDRLLAAIPLGRFGEPMEVAGAVVFLASDAGGYVTGATLDINGGRLMR